ncbi:MAG: hypothetical protein ABSA77_01485 [Thermoguttaceae bacterium]|jgi:hypothetical protein
MQVRKMQFDDYAAVNDVRIRNGLLPESIEHWEHFNKNNPFSPTDSHVPMGWVLENDNGKIVGIYGNYLLAYDWKGERLLAGVSHSWAVNPEYRQASLLLVSEYLQQKNVDLLINNSANKDTAWIFEMMKAHRLPAPYYDEVLTWIVNYPECIAAALRYKGAGVLKLLGYPLGLGLRTMDFLLRRNRFGRAPACVRQIEDFDERFDVFWAQLRQGQNILTAVRNREAMAWRFKFILRKKGALILILEDQGRMAGYIILLRQYIKRIGLVRYRVVDLKVLGQNAEHVEMLMMAALQKAREHNIDLVEVLGQMPHKRKILERFRPYRRKLTDWPFWFKVVKPRPEMDLDKVDAWDPSPFHGDEIFWEE